MFFKYITVIQSFEDSPAARVFFVNSLGWFNPPNRTSKDPQRSLNSVHATFFDVFNKLLLTLAYLGEQRF